jgi:L-fuconolactonase
MVIDAHQHFWHYDPRRDDWITDEMAVLKRDFLPQDLMPALAANGVDGCVAVQADQSERETRFLLELAERYEAIRGVVGWVDLRAPDVARRLEHFASFPRLRGLRHIAQAEPDDRFLLRDDFCRGIGLLGGWGFTYDLLVYPRQLPAAIELAHRFPDQPFVLDHLAKPPVRSGAVEPWARDVRALAQNPNVSCKLSGLTTEADWHGWRPADLAPYLDVVFDAFGPDRLLYGSDWPVCLLAGSYRQVKDAIDHYCCRLPPEQREDIFGRNAIAFYRLESTGHGSRSPA